LTDFPNSCADHVIITNMVRTSMVEMSVGNVVMGEHRDDAFYKFSVSSDDD
jgi:hypothetical protein